MKKTLLSRSNTVAAILTVLVVVFSFILGGCTSMGEIVEVVEKINEQDRREDAEKEQEAREESISNCLEELYDKYILLERDDIFVKEFEELIEEHFGGKERLLKCLERQKIYNDNHEEKNKLQDYLVDEENDILLNAEKDIKNLYDEYF